MADRIGVKDKTGESTGRELISLFKHEYHLEEYVNILLIFHY